MYNLARELPDSMWRTYDQKLGELAVRIKANLDGKVSDLPQSFLKAWHSFMDRFGYDGSDQLFVSSARYVDSPEILLGRIRHSAGGSVKDPAVTQQQKYT